MISSSLSIRTKFKYNINAAVVADSYYEGEDCHRDEVGTESESL